MHKGEDGLAPKTMRNNSTTILNDCVNDNADHDHNYQFDVDCINDMEIGGKIEQIKVGWLVHFFPCLIGMGEWALAIVLI